MAEDLITGPVHVIITTLARYMTNEQITFAAAEMRDRLAGTPFAGIPEGLEDIVAQRPGVLIAEVAVTFHGGKRCSFDCPSCGAQISYSNTYPLSFNWKVCPKCRLMWIPAARDGVGPNITHPQPEPGAHVGTIAVCADGVPQEKRT